MPVPKNKPTTSSPEGTTSQSSSPIVPEQEEFRQYLRRLAVSAVQVLIEQVMRETRGNKAEAARRLGITRIQLYTRLRKHGLDEATDL